MFIVYNSADHVKLDHCSISRVFKMCGSSSSTTMFPVRTTFRIDMKGLTTLALRPPPPPSQTLTNETPGGFERDAHYSTDGAGREAALGGSEIRDVHRMVSLPQDELSALKNMAMYRGLTCESKRRSGLCHSTSCERVCVACVVCAVCAVCVVCAVSVCLLRCVCVCVVCCVLSVMRVSVSVCQIASTHHPVTVRTCPQHFSHFHQRISDGSSCDTKTDFHFDMVAERR